MMQFSLWSALEISIASILVTRPSGLWNGAHGPGSDFLCLWSSVNMWSLSALCFTLVSSHPDSPAENLRTFMVYPGPYHLAGYNMTLYLFLFFGLIKALSFFHSSLALPDYRKSDRRNSTMDQIPDEIVQCWVPETTEPCTTLDMTALRVGSSPLWSVVLLTLSLALILAAVSLMILLVKKLLITFYYF